LVVPFHSAGCQRRAQRWWCLGKQQLVLHWLGRKRGWMVIVSCGQHGVVQQRITNELWRAGEKTK